ncbi:3-hydroxyacyl-CoA dehydrogenase family protein [Pseudorhodobacter sp. W20_MBD10_FR17]|uniref:3-hydroxyacyl-CoA dehydrogenase family protein n=1 Tax=Pseudorhodobacter sp. W20_MBD10_FR17 TaxID=3240266 RepID=UPI003F9699A9
MAKPKIAVLGAGLMGHGIAWLFAAAGHSVSVYDPDPAMLCRVPQSLADICELLGRPLATTGPVQLCETLAEACASAMFVFEAAPENLALKRALFDQLAKLAPANAIFASCTSTVPLAQIAQGNPAKTRIVGAHFWNPPYLVPLVEVIEVEGVNSAAIAPVMAVLAAAGRHPVHVRKDIAGFIGNRLQHALKREAIALVASGVCDATAIDDAVKYGFGKRLAVLGPMEESDLIGLDLTLAAHEHLMPVPVPDAAAASHAVLRSKVAAGDLGMKAGRGFRDWTDETAGDVRRRLADFLGDEAKNIAQLERNTK